MAIIDLMQHDFVNAASFTVDTTGPDSVSIVPIAAPVLSDYNGNSAIPGGDNFTILSMGYVLPRGYEAFQNAAGNMSAHATMIVKPATDPALPLEPGPAGVLIPFGNYELSLGITQDVTLITAEAYELQFKLEGLKVSMLNVPVSENGKVYKVPLFAKIAHTLKIT